MILANIFNKEESQKKLANSLELYTKIESPDQTRPGLK